MESILGWGSPIGLGAWFFGLGVFFFGLSNWFWPMGKRNKIK